MSTEDGRIALGQEKLKTVLETLQLFWEENGASQQKRTHDWRNILSVIDKHIIVYKIEDTRNEIEKMWDLCLTSDTEKNILKSSWNNDYSEEVLAQHKMQLDKLKCYYKEKQQLIDTIRKYEVMWDCVKNAEKEAKDPNRLFKNRGAQLLKEERERKMSTKLPKLEKAVYKMVVEHKKKTNEDFLVRGEVFSNLSQRLWKEYRGNKYQERRHVTTPKQGLPTTQIRYNESITKSCKKII